MSLLHLVFCLPVLALPTAAEVYSSLVVLGPCQWLSGEVFPLLLPNAAPAQARRAAQSSYNVHEWVV